MDSTAEGCVGFDETIVFLSYFRDLRDPRQQGKVTYPLEEILLLCLLAVLAGAETFVDIALFGEKKIDLLRRFRPFKDGTPAHDHLGDILAMLDAEAFQRCFVAWVASFCGVPEGVIAIDGKTVRRSHDKAGAKAAIHMVSAFAARQQGGRGAGARSSQSRGEIQRDRRHPQASGHADHRRRGHHHGCHGVSARDRPEDRRQGQLTAIVAVSRPGQSRFSTTSNGCASVTTGRA